MKYAKMSKLEYYIPNINPQCYAPIQDKIGYHMQWHLTTPMSIDSCRVLTLLRTLSHKLDVQGLQ